MHSFILDRHRGQQQQTPMQLNHQKSERKPQTRRRNGRDNPERGATLRGNSGKSAKPTAATRYAVYSGQDRLGSYGQAGDAWVAFTRLRCPLGAFGSESEAIDSIERSAAP